MRATFRSLSTGLVITAGLLALGACAPMTVNAYLQRGAVLERYHTYAWGPADAFSTGDPRLDNNAFFVARLREQVDRHLGARRFERADTSPDLLVHVHVNVTQQVDVRTLDRDVTYCEHADCRPFVFDAGTLFIDLVDPRTNTLVWRGWAEASFDGVIDRQEWMEKRVDDAVRRIMQRLPRV